MYWSYPLIKPTKLSIWWLHDAQWDISYACKEAGTRIEKKKLFFIFFNFTCQYQYFLVGISCVCVIDCLIFKLFQTRAKKTWIRKCIFSISSLSSQSLWWRLCASARSKRKAWWKKKCWTWRPMASNHVTICYNILRLFFLENT